jgi:hypothetical protein
LRRLVGVVLLFWVVYLPMRVLIAYSSTFFFTAGFQFAGTIVLGLLVVVVPRVEKKGPGRQGREEADMTEKRRLVELDLEEPLLG